MGSVWSWRRWGGGKLPRATSAAAALVIGASAVLTLTAGPASAAPAQSSPVGARSANTQTPASTKKPADTQTPPNGPAGSNDPLAAPSVTTAHPDGLSLHPIFNVTGTAQGATLTCSVSGPAGGPAVIISTCDVSSKLNLTGGDDGTYTLSVTQSQGGVTSDAGSASYTLDVTTPTITADSSVGSGSAPTFTVTNIDADTTLECTVSDPATATVTNCGPSTALDLSNAADGTYTVTVDAVDGSGDTSPTASASYEYESAAPPAPLVNGPSSPGGTTSPAFTVSDPENVDLTYTCTVSPSTVPTPTCGPTTTLDLRGAGDGSYTLTVTATDELQQTSAATTVSYTLDTSTPVPVVSLLSPASSPAADLSPSFSIHDSEALDGPDTFSCAWNGPDGSSVSSGTCASGDSFSASAGDGPYTLTVTATDGAGNSASASPVRYVLESGPPPAPTVTVQGQSAGRQDHVSFSVSDSENVDLTYNCSVVGLPAAVVTACGTTTTLDLTGVADGSYELDVTATDGLADVSPAGSSTYTLDTSTPAPIVSLAPPLMSPSANTAPMFLITDAEDLDGPDTFSCIWAPPTGPPISVPSCLSGQSFPATAGNGIYTLTVSATDSVGNSATAVPVTYELEVGPPPTPVVVAAQPFGNDLSPSFAVTDTENVPLTYSCSVVGLPAADITTCGPTTTLDLSSAPDGAYTLAVTATDGLGDTSDAGTAGYTLDTATPVPAVALRAPTVSPSSNLAPTFSINDAETPDGPDTFSCAWQPPTGAEIDFATCHNREAFAASEGDGSYTLTVTATDKAGNTATAAPVTYTLDTTRPGTPTVALNVPATSPGNVTTPQFTVTDPDSSPGAGLTFGCTVTGPSTVLASQVSCGPTTTVDLTGRDGAYTLSVTATDAAGNVSLVAGTATYTLDTAAPVAPTVKLTVPANSPGNVVTPHFAVTDVDHSPGGALTFACSVTGVTPVPSSAISCGATTTIDLSGGGRDGVYVLSVTATDAAGNLSAVGTATYTLDTTVPGAPVVTLPVSSTKLPTFGISDADPTATLTCLLISPKGKTVFPTVPPGVCPANGTFDTTANVDGTYTLTVTATDPALNSISTTVTWIRDTTAPTAPTVTLSSPTSPGTTTALQFAVSASDNSPVPGLTFTCSVTGPTPVPPSAVNCAVPMTSVNLGAARDGIYTLAVTATDVAGNVSAAGTATYALDTTPPAAPTVTLAAPLTSPGNVTDPQFTVSDPDSSPVPGLTYSCSVTGPTTVPSSAISCAGPTTAVNLSGAGRDGTYRLSVTATDQALNTSASAGAATYTLDTTPPATPAVALLAPAASPSNVTDPTFSVSDPDASPGRGLTYSCAVVGSTPVPASAISCGAPVTSVDLSGTGRDGTYTLSIIATDAAGNVSAVASTTTYLLDTTAPLPPVVELASATRSDSQSPLWTWQFGFADVNTTLDTATCTLLGPNGWTSTTTACGHHVTMDLGGGDGSYTLTVTLTDEAGNTSVATSPVYTLDSTAPAGPTAYLRSPSSSAGLSRHPLFIVKGPVGATLLCALLQGGHNGTPLAPEAVCPDPARYSLIGLPDGQFTLRVVAVDTAGNRSFPAWVSYALIPPAPHVHPPTSQRVRAVWTVGGNPNDAFVCTLSHQGQAVAGPQGCGNHPTYDMSRFERGNYTLSVVQLGGANVDSAAGSATWFWDGPAPTAPGPPPPSTPPAVHHPKGGAARTPPKTPKSLSSLPGVVRHQIHRIGRAIPPVPIIHPVIHPDKITEAVGSAVQGVVHAVGVDGGGTGFPLLLVGLVLAFLLAQNRIDRRDPKLALASVAADDMVEFHAPPSRRNRP